MSLHRPQAPVRCSRVPLHRSRFLTSRFRSVAPCSRAHIRGRLTAVRCRGSVAFYRRPHRPIAYPAKCVTGSCLAAAGSSRGVRDACVTVTGADRATSAHGRPVSAFRRAAAGGRHVALGRSAAPTYRAASSSVHGASWTRSPSPTVMLRSARPVSATSLSVHAATWSERAALTPVQCDARPAKRHRGRCNPLGEGETTHRPVSGARRHRVASRCARCMPRRRRDIARCGRCTPHLDRCTRRCRRSAVNRSRRTHRFRRESPRLRDHTPLYLTPRTLDSVKGGGAPSAWSIAPSPESVAAPDPPAPV